MDLESVYRVASEASLKFEKTELDEFFGGRAWLSIQQMLCRSIAHIMQEMADPKTEVDQIKRLQFLLLATNEMLAIENRVRCAVVADPEDDTEIYLSLKELTQALSIKEETPCPKK